MYLSPSTVTFVTICVSISSAHPLSVEKRLDCGPSSQYYQPGANCENTLYAPGGGHGGYGCGPASLYYKPGPNCENTLYTIGGSASGASNTTSDGNGALSGTGGDSPQCGPVSQWYKPGPNCENTLYTS